MLTVQSKYTKTFTEEDRAQSGIARAQKHFQGLNLRESTVRYFKKMYLTEVSKHVKIGDSTEVTHLQVAKRGRKVALGEQLDAEVWRYLQRLRENGTSISTTLVLAAAEGCLLGRDRTVLVEYGVHVSLTMDWARSLLIRIGYVKRKATTKANTKLQEDEFLRLKTSFLQEIVAIVRSHKIPLELVINRDETGLQLVPVGNWTVAPEGSRRVEVAGLGDKRQITVTFAGTLSGELLPMQILYQGKTDHCHAKFTFPDGFHIYH